ncbi:MAG: nuclear transport factor 2 family protein [Sphingomonadaceae bacterium]|nr:nuclear transport factor 2 family protein [Sphingomonadaceae bacterium]
MTDELAELRAEIEALKARTQRAEDHLAIMNLQAAYGYYVDKTQWDDAADLFAEDATLEIAARGQYHGRERIRAYLHALPKLEYGTVFNHMQLQPVITLDGDRAAGRWRTIMEVGFLGREALRGEGTYENRYVREAGVWKIARLHAFITYYTSREKGWSEGGVPMGRELAEIAPDAPQTVDYGSFPDVYVPPYHYPNPVTGRGYQPA